MIVKINVTIPIRDALYAWIAEHPAPRNFWCVSTYDETGTSYRANYYFSNEKLAVEFKLRFG